MGKGESTSGGPLGREDITKMEAVFHLYLAELLASKGLLQIGVAAPESG